MTKFEAKSEISLATCNLDSTRFTGRDFSTDIVGRKQHIVYK